MKNKGLYSIIILCFFIGTVAAGAGSPANVTAYSYQPVNNSNLTAGAMEFEARCIIDSVDSLPEDLTGARIELFYYENASFYGYVDNTSNVINDTNFNISFISPSQSLNFTWYAFCYEEISAGVSGNLTLNLEAGASPASYFLTSVLSSPADGSTQTVAETVSLTGSCETNATLANATFWVYDSNGAVYTALANSSAISNATAFSRSLTLPIQVTTMHWNLECADNESQTANATSNYSFSIVSVGGSGSAPPECAGNVDCTIDSYCSESVCIECDVSKDGICRSCAKELNITDLDCAKPTPTATPQPTIEGSGSGSWPSPTPLPSPTPGPREEKVSEASSGSTNAGVCSSSPSQLLEIKRRLVVTEENGNHRTLVTLQVTNLGAETLLDTHITERLPNGLTSIQLTFLSRPDKDYDDRVVWAIPKLTPGDSVYFEYYAEKYIALSEFQEPGVSCGEPVLVPAYLNFNYDEWPVWYWLILLLLPCWLLWSLSRGKYAKARLMKENP